MENKNIELDIKFAHGEGHTVFTFSSDEMKIVTGGIDGEVRIWSLKEGEENDDPESFDVGAPIYGLEINVILFLFKS